MAKFINPFQQGDELELEKIAKKAGVQVPAQKKSILSKVIDVLNKPSQLTEKALTGGKSYEEAGLGKKSSFVARLALDPLNILPIGLLGKGLKVGAKVSGVAKGAELAGKIPAVAKTTSALGELFIPGYKLSKVSPDLAKALPALEKLIGARQTQAVRKTAELGKELAPDIRKNIGKLVETAGQGGKLTDEELTAVQKATGFIGKNITEPEKLAGVSPAEVANYFPRKAEREGVEHLLKFGGKRLSLSLGGAEKGRKFVTQTAGEAAGVAYKEPLEALAIRASKSEAARANQGFLKKLIGGEVKDIDGNPLLAPIKGVVEDGYEEFSLKSLKGFQAPKEAVKEIEKYYKTFISDDATNALLKFYDKGLGVWKGSVTSLFPAFHIRNAIGNLSNMWLGGFNPTSLPKLATAAKIQRGKEVVINGTKVTRELVAELGLSGRGQFGADIPKVLGDVLGQKNIAQKLNPFERGRQAGTLIEDNSKIAFFIDRLSKGDNVEQAVAQTKKYLFDYTSLTDFEKNVMRRVVPFYTWMRNNVPLQIESLIKKPGKQALIAKSFSNLSPLTEEQKSALPTYLTEGLTASRGETEEGDLKLLYGSGLPFEDLGRLNRGGARRTFEREGLGATGPLGNLLGIGLKRDFFRGKPTEELAYSYGKMAKDYPKPLRKLLEYKEEKTKTGKTTYHVNATKFQILNLIAPRILRTYGDPTTGVEPFRETEVNIESAKASKQREIEDQLAKILQEKGIVKEFSKYYIPKGTEGGSKFINPF